MNNEEVEEYLAEHTIYMRKAFKHCSGLFDIIFGAERPQGEFFNDISKANKMVDEARISALSVSQQRREALRQFCGKQKNSLHPFTEKCASKDVDYLSLEVIDITSNNNEAHLLTELEFRKRFQIGNIPCLIRGMEQTEYFSSVYCKWRSCDQLATNDGPRNNNGADVPCTSNVNREWFYQKLGEIQVPVRFQPSSSHGVLDEEGRAMECETRQMSLRDWTDLLDQAEKTQESISCLSDHYLKDWHLQSMLRQSVAGLGNSLSEPPEQLYTVPPYFQFDLLNSFLVKFTDNGDYMFTYWGPKGSRTTLHSDVLNSFSWSFNVSGTKEWKFFPPKPDPDEGDSYKPLVVIQHEGECVFVASGWKHEVTNLEETLSINHNWITTSNIDRVWECLSSEMNAIDVELGAWDMGDDCWDAKESMLRGCVGLDVTGFFFMMLTHLLEVLQQQLLDVENAENNKEDSIWQCYFDLFRLQAMLRMLFKEEKLGLEDRLAAALNSEISAGKAIEIAKYSMATIDSIKIAGQQA